MIPVSQAAVEPVSWQLQLKNMTRSLAELLDLVDISINQLPKYEKAERSFPVRATAHYLSLIKKGDLDDPLLKQILPDPKELKSVDGFIDDALMESEYRHGEGLIRKYKSRVLLVTNGTCAVHCRYCFRRHYPYDDDQFSVQDLTALDQFLKQHQDVNELILSGGDPLIMPVRTLDKIIAVAQASETIKRIRIHSRIPSVLPQRFDHEFISWWNSIGLDKILVTHINHPQEIDENLSHALTGLDKTTLLNQSVLLNGVNNNTETLVDLSEKCFSVGILPYYLHLLDPVRGTAHFDVNELEAKSLMSEIKGLLPGFLVPKLVKEIPGESNKTVIA